MTTQKVTGALRKHGFKSFFTQKEWHGNSKISVRYGHYKVSISKSKKIGIETFGISTKDQIDALKAEGIQAEEAIEGSGVIIVK
jgi:transposase